MTNTASNSLSRWLAASRVAAVRNSCARNASPKETPTRVRSFCSTGRSVTPPAWHGSSLRRMLTGLFLPIFGELSDPRVTAGLAAEAEGAGFDGVFVWDHVQYRAPATHVADAWTTLAAMAVATERVDRSAGHAASPAPTTGRRPSGHRDRPAVGRAPRARRRHRP